MEWIFLRVNTAFLVNKRPSEKKINFIALFVEDALMEWCVSPVTLLNV